MQENIHSSQHSRRQRKHLKLLLIYVIDIVWKFFNVMFWLIEKDESINANNT